MPHCWKSHALAQFYNYSTQEEVPAITDNGYKGDFLHLIYRDQSLDTAIATSFLRSWGQAGRPEFEIKTLPLPSAEPRDLLQQPALRRVLQRDHVAFWLDKIPAIYICDSGSSITILRDMTINKEHTHKMVLNVNMVKRPVMTFQSSLMSLCLSHHTKHGTKIWHTTSKACNNKGTDQHVLRLLTVCLATFLFTLESSVFKPFSVAEMAG